MLDQSELDRKYFIDDSVYNCPFCNRRHVVYDMRDIFEFDWSAEKKCFAYLVQCASCKHVSMDLSFDDIRDKKKRSVHGAPEFREGTDIDSKVFYSVPTSFFVVDSRIPRVIRELITEADGCLKMNYLTGASACTRKAIYELLELEEVNKGEHYEERIKSLKKKYPSIDPNLFDILSQIQGMTSDKVHEQSWDKWDSPNLKLVIETVKAVLYEIYVLSKVKQERSLQIQRLQENITKDRKKGQPV
jgi:hypothetical protein